MAGLTLPVAGLFAIGLASGGDDRTTARPRPTYTRPTLTPVPTAGSDRSNLVDLTEDVSGEQDSGEQDSDDSEQNGVSNAQLTRANKLYQAGPLPSVGCREPSAKLTSVDGARAYYKPIVECLHKSWPRLVTKAGAEFRKPTVITWAGSVESPCGAWSSGAFYCSSNETIYLDWADDVERYTDPDNSVAFGRMVAFDTVAHEYGHHIQELTGIIEASDTIAYDADSKDLELEFSRRLELQANCFAAVFIGANQQSYPVMGQNREEWMHLTHNSGDNYNPEGIRDHGDKKSQAFWGLRGFRTENPGSCNTYSASSAQVY